MLVPRKESLVLASTPMSRGLLESHLFYRNPRDLFDLVSLSGQRGTSSIEAHGDSIYEIVR